MTGTFPLVTIITPVYNGAEFLEPLIESVQSQSYPNIEHIVIDDGSQDDGKTKAILSRYPHIKSWSRQNRGQYPTMNEGLQAATGEWVCFISADDLMEPDAVNGVIQIVLQRADCDVIYGKARFVRDVTYKMDTLSGDEVKLENDAVQGWLTWAPPGWYPWVGHIYHCSVYVKRSDLLERGLIFDEKLKYTGDFDWMVRLVRSGLNFRYKNKILASVRIHPEKASIVHTEQQTQEHALLLERYGINRWLYTRIAGIRYLRSILFETISMLGRGQFKTFGWRAHRWFRNKVSNRQVNKN